MKARSIYLSYANRCDVLLKTKSEYYMFMCNGKTNMKNLPVSAVTFCQLCGIQVQHTYITTI